MGPRPCGRGRLERTAVFAPVSLLQWGHGLAAVDGCRPRHAVHIGPRASMGPRPCGRGRRAPQCTRPLVDRASMGPRPCGRGRTAPRDMAAPMAGLQWGHGLAAVDGPSPSHAAAAAVTASMGPRPCGRGRHTRRCHHRARALASMGPRPCGRGRAQPPTTDLPENWGFNGATALRPWTASRRPAA